MSENDGSAGDPAGRGHQHQRPSAAALFPLEGLVALVTGATSGIGHAIAATLACAGAHVVLSGLPAENPAAVAQDLTAELGLAVHGVGCDVTDAVQLDAMVKEAVQSFGRLDIVVANAGIALDSGPHTSSTDQQLDTMIDIHLRSTLRLANLALPHLIGRGGSFVIMSSIAGLRGNRLLGLYGITKAANAQLARNLAVQWGQHNIRVNAFSPGVIDTDFARPITADSVVATARLAKTPLGRLVSPTT